MNDFVMNSDPGMAFPWFTHQEMYDQCLYLVQNWSGINLDTDGSMYYETNKKL